MRKVTFSSDSLPEKDRVEGTSHFVSSLGGKVKMAHYSNNDFCWRFECQELVGLYSVVMHASAVFADSAGGGPLSDHINIGFCFDPDAGRWALGYRGAETTIYARDACLRVLELPSSFKCEAPVHGRSIAIPAEEVFRRLKSKDSAFAPSLPGATPGLSLLRQYLGVFDRGDALSDPVEQRLFASHVYDLMALVLGANADALEQARHGGLRAARLKAAEDFIDAHVLDPDLSDRAVAAHLGVSDRYVRMLFAGGGTSCKSYIDARRLAAAFAMLTNPVWAPLKIIDLAYRCGFNDITTFNRQFRARYGMTPSEARQALPGARPNRGDWK
ncbi:helix-turn-helix transcriptional regulator [Methylocystis sp. H4A]|uniref:helix-turn-helix transcriptional regulator n=1 Tax=Methylocystis sp. H4A TaxID=2785788 RepID=UPI0018C22292|nr:AraC family transcriptional regulator [Methylocystis sp. H4A]MBG0800943.1 helix-turn-helix transcriptional regulator [Methylocystis sp. H4A]